MENKNLVVVAVVAVLLIFYLKSKESFDGAVSSQLYSKNLQQNGGGCNCSGMQCNTGNAISEVYRGNVPNQALSQPYATLINGERPIPKEMAHLQNAPLRKPNMPYDIFSS
jgi:hypothetical protein